MVLLLLHNHKFLRKTFCWAGLIAGLVLTLSIKPFGFLVYLIFVIFVLCDDHCIFRFQWRLMVGMVSAAVLGAVIGVVVCIIFYIKAKKNQRQRKKSNAQRRLIHFTRNKGELDLQSGVSVVHSEHA